MNSVSARESVEGSEKMQVIRDALGVNLSSFRDNTAELTGSHHVKVLTFWEKLDLLDVQREPRLE